MHLGKLERSMVSGLGLVGVTARACAVPQDVRNNFPNPVALLYPYISATHPDGTVHSRAWVRWLECGPDLMEQGGRARAAPPSLTPRRLCSAAR